MDKNAISFPTAGVLPEIGRPIYSGISVVQDQRRVYDMSYLAPRVGSPPDGREAAFKPTTPTLRAVFPRWITAHLCNSPFLTYLNAHLPWAWPQFSSACHRALVHWFIGSLTQQVFTKYPLRAESALATGNLAATVHAQRSQMSRGRKRCT